MTIYSVHEPPMSCRASDRDAGEGGPERYVFVRDGFHFWAFLTPLLWMLYHRLWLVLLGYLGLCVALVFGLMAAGSSRAGATLALLALAILIGLEASTLRRWTLRRNGWDDVGVVEGRGRDDAERRFFQGRVEKARRSASAVQPRPAAGSVPRFVPDPEIIGLFPRPEARR